MLICSLLLSSKPFWLEKTYLHANCSKIISHFHWFSFLINILATLVRQDVGWVALNLLLGKFGLFKQLAQLLMKW